MFGAGTVENLLPAAGCCRFACRTTALFGHGRLPDLRIRFGRSLFVGPLGSALNFEYLARVYASRFRHQMFNSFTLIGIIHQCFRNS